MKLKELAAFSVIQQSNEKKIFSGTRSECIAFIKGFDKGSTEYVDLRLTDPSGKEDKWH
jgi:hypothetical protein